MKAIHFLRMSNRVALTVLTLNTENRKDLIRHMTNERDLLEKLTCFISTANVPEIQLAFNF